MQTYCFLTLSCIELNKDLRENYANGLYSCYIVGDAIGHAIRFIIDYTNEKAIECAIDYAIGNVNGQ